SCSAVCSFLRWVSPLPTLFPYTTLFRSADRHPRADVRPHRGGRSRTRPATPRGRATDRGRVWPANAALVGPASHRIAGQTRPRSDRKSTRLNSSHLGISYAVFCLKKKNH